MTVPACPHPHGTRQRYAPRNCHPPCRQQCCKDAWARYTRALRADRAAGVPRLVPAGPVRKHLLTLRAGRLGAPRISELTGIAPSYIRHLAAGKRQHVLTCTAETLLAVDLRSAVLVPATGTVRRLRALCAVGFDQGELGARLGYSRSWANALLRHHGAGTGHVHHRTAAKVAALYDELETADGDSERMRAAAARRNWAPPHAWLPETIDEPTARAWDGVRLSARADIDPTKVERICGGESFERITLGERRAVVAALRTEHRMNDLQIVRRTGFQLRTVQRIRAFLELPAATKAAA